MAAESPPGGREPRPAHPESARASRSWWDRDVGAYLAEHGGFLGAPDAPPRLVWGPEGWTEDELGLLGPVTGHRVLEVGCGAAQCSRWVRAQGGHAVALDLSYGMLRAAPADLPRVQADAVALPFRAGSFDLAFTSYGALQFLPDVAAVFREVHRVLRTGGRWVFSVSHPVRWAFPDDPGPRGLTADRSYFDRSAYVERDPDGTLAYVEHHHTLGDYVRALAESGFALLDLREPEWPRRNQASWSGWSPLRGAILPGTAIFVTRTVG